MYKCSLSCRFCILLGTLLVPEYFSYMLQHCHMQKVGGASLLTGCWEGRMDEDGQTDKMTADMFEKLTQQRRGGNHIMIEGDESQKKETKKRENP